MTGSLKDKIRKANEARYRKAIIKKALFYIISFAVIFITWSAWTYV